MKKIFNNPLTYVLAIGVLFSIVNIYVGNVITTILSALIMIVFYGIGNMGKEQRETLAKSIGGGGIPRPNPDDDKDDDDNPNDGVNP